MPWCFNFCGGGVSVTQTQQQKAFDEGRTYRISFPFSIPQTGGEIYFKYEVNGDTDLTLSNVKLSQGGVEYTVWLSAQASGESGITNPITIYPRNSKSTTPTRAPVNAISYGESVSGATLILTGEPNTTELVRTASGNIARSSVLSGSDSSRGFPVTTVYVRIKKLDGINTDSIGVLIQEFIEYD